METLDAAERRTVSCAGHGLAVCTRRACPEGSRLGSRPGFPEGRVSSDGRPWFPGDAGPRGAWRRNNRPCRLCARTGRSRSRMRRGVHGDVRAQFRRLRTGPALRDRSAEIRMAGADGQRRSTWRLLPDRTACRIRRLGPADTGAADQYGMGPGRGETVHHLGRQCRRRDRLCRHRSRCGQAGHFRVYRSDLDAGIPGCLGRAEAGTASFGHRADRVRRDGVAAGGVVGH